MNTEERTITIVDDIMGSGKSTWAINYINDNPDRKFLCIVPLLSECERFKDGTDIDIVDPEKWGSKWKHFRWLVENEKNIVTTHSLIQKMDLDMLELLKSKDYVLMIDECLDVLDTYKITKDDMKIIFEQKLVSLDDKGFLIWNDDKKYKGVFGDINAHEKNIDLTKAHGDYEKSSDYDTKISDKQAERAIKQNEVNELTKQLNDGVAAGTIVENSQEWLDMTTQIKEAENAVADYDNTIEELKQQQIGVYYEEQFERAAEKVDRFRDKLDGLKALISDDMKIDKNTGLLTESGALAITLDVDDINASTENLKTYIKERQQIINDYNAGKFGEDEYNQKLKDIDENIKSTTANIYSSRNSILELVKSQSQAELDVLNKVIDKRKEALSAKKSYYDYDKTLKNKTKDIEVLERQIAALEGSTSAEDKARKAKLQEQLQSAKDDLNDTITDHAYSMQTDALDKLSTDMSEDLDKWINTISSNMEEMTTAINDAVKNAGLSTAGTINAISSILRHYGLSDSEISQSGLSDIKGYASGTDYVPKSGMYRVNEKGMESVFSKQYGTLTFLSQGDKVFTADFTKQLLDNSTIATQKNMPDYAGMAKAIEKNIQNIQNLSGNTYVNNFYIDGAQDTDSILKEIDKHLDKKIQAHDKKQVRDFRSLH